ncbi:MAG: FG-GAP repeat domain-containing protein [Candidatus Bipolaricaulia bacterium]
MRALVFRLAVLVVGLAVVGGFVVAQPRGPVSTDFADETATRLQPDRDRSFWVRAADIDKDGDLDLIVGNRPGDPALIRVLINQQGKFENDSARRIPAIPSQIPFGADLGDIDRDGDLDIVLAMGGGQGGGEPDRILVNTGAGLFQDETSNRLPGVVINRSFAARFCDVDSDGDLDLFVGTQAGEPARLWMNDGTGRYADESGSRFQQVGSFSVAAADCADLDGDKDNDLVLGTGEPTQGGVNQVNRVLINSNRGFFTDETAYRVSFEQGTNTTAIKYLDVDGDGDLDVFACNNPITPPTIAGRAVLWINNGKGFFSDETALRLPFGVFNCVDFDYADFDGDKDLDIAMVRAQQTPQAPNLLLMNDGRGYFIAIDLPVEGGNEGGNGVVFKDLTGDGKPDIYIARDGKDVLLINKATTSRP